MCMNNPCERLCLLKCLCMFSECERMCACKYNQYECEYECIYI